jgi:predicted DNA-binding transcriptional regulator AlpA
MTDQTSFDMIDIRELEQVLQRTERTIRRMIAKRGFPRPVVAGRWRRADVSRWMDSRTSSDIPGHLLGSTAETIVADDTSGND